MTPPFILDKTAEAQAALALSLKTAHLCKDASDLFRNSQPFRDWFGRSHVVEEDGTPKVVYRGDYKGDLLQKGFDLKRQTSAKGFYFTDDPQIASNYSENKPYHEDTGYENWYTFPSHRYPRERLIPNLASVWYRLSPEEKERLRETLKVAGMHPETGEMDFSGENILVGQDQYDWAARQKGHYDPDYMHAAYDTWLSGGALFNREEDFGKLLEHAGIPYVYQNPYDPAHTVTPVYLSIQHPLDTSAVPPALGMALEKRLARTRSRKPPAIGWDKDDYNPRDWVRSFQGAIREAQAQGAVNEDGTVQLSQEMTFTVIPDKVADALVEMGYDGIKDAGGKNGGNRHTVWIAFHPHQIHSALSPRVLAKGQKPYKTAGAATLEPTQDAFYKNLGQYMMQPSYDPVSGERRKELLDKYNAVAEAARFEAWHREHAPEYVSDPEERQRNLLRWFGRSVVKDAAGRPLPVYHGTSGGDFDLLDPYANPRNGHAFRSLFHGGIEDPKAFLGIHFGTQKAAEDRLMALPAKGQRLIPCYLKIENPLGTMAQPLSEDALDLLCRRMGANWVWEHYDGVIYKNEVEDKGSLSFIVFSPYQAKSVTGNTGHFEPGEMYHQAQVEGPAAGEPEGPEEPAQEMPLSTGPKQVRFQFPTRTEVALNPNAKAVDDYGHPIPEDDWRRQHDVKVPLVDLPVEDDPWNGGGTGYVTLPSKEEFLATDYSGTQYAAVAQRLKDALSGAYHTPPYKDLEPQLRAQARQMGKYFSVTPCPWEQNTGDRSYSHAEYPEALNPDGSRKVFGISHLTFRTKFPFPLGSQEITQTRDERTNLPLRQPITVLKGWETPGTVPHVAGQSAAQLSFPTFLLQRPQYALKPGDLVLDEHAALWRVMNVNPDGTLYTSDLTGRKTWHFHQNLVLPYTVYLAQGGTPLDTGQHWSSDLTRVFTENASKAPQWGAKARNTKAVEKSGTHFIVARASAQEAMRSAAQMHKVFYEYRKHPNSGQYPNSGQLKGTLVRNLARRLHDDPVFHEGREALPWNPHIQGQDLSDSVEQYYKRINWSPEGHINTLIKTWAVTSTKTPLSKAVQYAAMKEFGYDAAFDHIYGSEKSVLKRYGKEGVAAIQRFLRAMHEETQDFFQQAGVGRLYLYRGMSWKEQVLKDYGYSSPQWVAQDAVEMAWQYAKTGNGDNRPPGYYMSRNAKTLWEAHVAALQQTHPGPWNMTLQLSQVTMQPVSAFTADPSIMYWFSDKMDGKVARLSHCMYLSAVVPVERIISTPFTGMGCFREAEFTVMGGPEMMRAFMKDNWNEDTRNLRPGPDDFWGLKPGEMCRSTRQQSKAAKKEGAK